MAGMMMKIACIVVACMVVSAPFAEAITCGQVVSSLLPCLGYLRSTAPLSAGCCSGVKNLNAAASNSAARKQACSCLKNAYSSYSGINPSNAAGLPGKCGVNIPYKISPSTDCSKVQ